ncbi:MAG: hypothetical protein KGY50_00830 [Candidatus Thermoplasmatota archaeon]|nr:hypothetical protein [Candidatus Thermoplasmatota archaeon]
MAKNSSDKELEKIHQILDNTLSNSSEKKQDQYLSSLKRRVSNDQKMAFSSQPKKRSTDTDLTPRVVIKKKEKPLEKTKEKKAVQFEEEKDDFKIVPSSGVSVSDDELFEVEKPLREKEEIPEFIEVTPEQKEKEEKAAAEEEPLTIKISSEEYEEVESLPQWQAVEDPEPNSEEDVKPAIVEKKKSFFESKPEKRTERKEEKSLDDQKESSFKKIGKDKTEIWEPLESKKDKKPVSKTTSFKKVSEEKQPEEETFSPSETKGFQYNDYTLYQKTIIINDEDKRTIHFFAKKPPETGKPAELPEDYEVKINRKTGVPYIRKKHK